MSWILLLPSFKKAQYSKKSENSKIPLQYYGSEKNQTLIHIGLYSKAIEWATFQSFLSP